MPCLLITSSSCTRVRTLHTIQAAVQTQRVAVTFGLHFATQIHRTASFLISLLPTPKPMYDMIWQLSLVRYDLVDYPLYDIYLRATHTTIPSTRGVQIPIDLVSSATDSFWRRVVLFKHVRIPTSDPKSEFLYQSSSIVHDLQTSP